MNSLCAGFCRAGFLQGVFLLTVIGGCPVWVQGAKVIMKDGKIFEGKIIAETDGDVLITTSPVDRPKFLPNDAILTVVHDPVKAESKDPQRYASLGLRLMGNVFSSKNIALDPSAGLALTGGLRFHPFVEIGASGEWTPVQPGSLSANDGISTRGYGSFFSYGGSLWTKLYPLFQKYQTVEPFLTVGYRWSNIVPNNSGDALKGGGIDGGVGAQWPFRKNVYFEAGLLYHHDSYGVIHFRGIDDALDPRIRADSYSLMTGISIHL